MFFVLQVISLMINFFLQVLILFIIFKKKAINVKKRKKMSYFLLCKILNFTQKKNTFNVSEQLQILRNYKLELKKRKKKDIQLLKSLEF